MPPTDSLPSYKNDRFSHSCSSAFLVSTERGVQKIVTKSHLPSYKNNSINYSCNSAFFLVPLIDVREKRRQKIVNKVRSSSFGINLWLLQLGIVCWKIRVKIVIKSHLPFHKNLFVQFDRMGGGNLLYDNNAVTGGSRSLIYARAKYYLGLFEWPRVVEICKNLWKCVVNCTECPSCHIPPFFAKWKFKKMVIVVVSCGFPSSDAGGH